MGGGFPSKVFEVTEVLFSLQCHPQVRGTDTTNDSWFIDDINDTPERDFAAHFHVCTDKTSKSPIQILPFEFYGSPAHRNQTLLTLHFP